MIYFLELIYFLFLLKEILKCLYFWQLKEYRFDRFKDLLKTQPKRIYFLPGLHLFRPRLTLKILILIYLSFYFSILVMNLLSFPILPPILAYLFVPLSVTASVILLKPISDFIIDLIVLAAKVKMKFMPQSQIVIGITGSYAKTSIKEIISHVLASRYTVCKTLETKNTLIGVALTILKSLKKSHQIFVVEMGAYKIGEIKSICNLVKPSIGVLTGLTSQHLSLFGSFKNLLKAKSELLEALPKKSLAFFNGEDQEVKILAKNFFSLTKIFYFHPKSKYSTNLIGDYQQLNLQAGALLAQKLQVPLSLIKERFKTIPSSKTQITKKLGLNGSTIVSNTYNANPEGFKAAINYVQSLPTPNKILITSGIIELGSDTAKHHQAINNLAKPVFSKIYITKPNLVKFFPTAVLITDPKKLLSLLKPKLNSKTLVLLISRLPQKFISQLA